MSSPEEELSGAALDIDVVGLPDITEFKSEADLYDFDSGTEYGLFGEAGADLSTPSTSQEGNNIIDQCSMVATQSTGHIDQHSVVLEMQQRCGGDCSLVKRPRFKSTKRKQDWTPTEKDLFQKGLELIGPNWNKISRFISTKSPSQIKSYHRKWSETANVIQDSTEDFSVSYVMVPSSAELDVLLEDPLDILQTATTTVQTSPFECLTTSTATKLTNSLESSFMVNVNSSARLETSVDETSATFQSSSLKDDEKVLVADVKDMSITLDQSLLSRTSLFSVQEYSSAAASSPTCVPSASDGPISSYDDDNEENLSIGTHVSGGVSNDNECDSTLSTITNNNDNGGNKSREFNSTFKVQSVSSIKRKSKQKLKTSPKKLKVFNINPDINKLSSELHGHLSSVVDINGETQCNLQGQIIRISKDDSNEDSDVDIDISDGEQECKKSLSEFKEKKSTDNVKTSPSTAPDHRLTETGQCVQENLLPNVEYLTFSIPPPLTEFNFNPLDISDEEKTIHFDFFSEKGVKTPDRYLKIRNTIIDVWKQNKPNYLGKTAARKIIKNCGDVNSIGKIHEYLEKKGSINYGCHSAKYDAPLIISTINKIRSNRDSIKVDRSSFARLKNNKFRIGLSEGGGLTIRHDDSGAVVDACHIPEGAKQRGSGKNSKLKNEQFKLIRCSEYSSLNKHNAPFSVIVHPQSLVTMDLHSHSCITEVMGLVGGYHDTSSGSVHVTVAVPTRATSSGVECDMCPVSQSEACVRIEECGVQVIGWYHSHPNFPPKPSLQDIQSQSTMQNWFARRDSPFLGFIVSPFCPTNRNESSNIQCLILDRKPGEISEENTTPFKLVWKVSEEKHGKWTDLNKEIREVVSGSDKFGVGIEWRKEWKPKLTYWEKAVRSLELLLPSNMTSFVQQARQAFILAIREGREDR